MPSPLSREALALATRPDPGKSPTLSSQPVSNRPEISGENRRIFHPNSNPLAAPWFPLSTASTQSDMCFARIDLLLTSRWNCGTGLILSGNGSRSRKNRKGPSDSARTVGDA